jgi:hypothetical protein
MVDLSQGQRDHEETRRKSNFRWACLLACSAVLLAGTCWASQGGHSQYITLEQNDRPQLAWETSGLSWPALGAAVATQKKTSALLRIAGHHARSTRLATNAQGNTKALQQSLAETDESQFHVDQKASPTLSEYDDIGKVRMQAALDVSYLESSILF